MLPFLKSLSDGQEHKLPEIHAAMEKHFKLSEEEFRRA